MTITKKSHKFALGVGSNLGEPRENIAKAGELLKEFGAECLQVSALMITEPIDCIDGTPDFLNGAFTGIWHGTLKELHEICQKIEILIGRPSVHSSRESRVIDLDILLFDEQEVDTDHLKVPHPRMLSRRFVLEPLAEIAGNWIVPKAGTVIECLNKLDR